MSTNANVFIKNGHFCVVPPSPNEVTECYVYRGYSILNQKPANQMEFDKYLLLSKYLSNIKFFGCTYSKKIHEKCKLMDGSIQ